MADKYISLGLTAFFAFNIWSIESAKAVIDGCAVLGRDALLQTSMKAYDGCDKAQLRSFVTSYSRDKGIMAYLHLDHCKDVSAIQEAIRYGWDSVMIDGSGLDLEENIKLTNEVIPLAREGGVLIEAEVGQITGNNGIANFDDVMFFMDATDVDMLAVAIGTSHGFYKGSINLDYNLLGRVNAAARIPLVIHGGSGLSDDTLLELMSYQKVKKVNISTDVKQAYRMALIRCHGDGVFKREGFDPLIVTQAINQTITEMVMQKERLLDRA